MSAPLKPWCIFRHRWSKWEQFVVAVKQPVFGQIEEGQVTMQKRVCERCGYMQRKEVDGY